MAKILAKLEPVKVTINLNKTEVKVLRESINYYSFDYERHLDKGIIKDDDWTRAELDRLVNLWDRDHFSIGDNAYTVNDWQRLKAGLDYYADYIDHYYTDNDRKWLYNRAKELSLKIGIKTNHLPFVEE